MSKKTPVQSTLNKRQPKIYPVIVGDKKQLATKSTLSEFIDTIMQMEARFSQDVGVEDASVDEMGELVLDNIINESVG